MLAVVLAAVTVVGAVEMSGSRSKFVSVSSSFEGVKVMAGSGGGTSGAALIASSTFATLEESTGGAGNPSLAVVASVAVDSGAGADETCGTCLGAGAGLGFSNSLFQPDTLPAGMMSLFCSVIVPGAVVAA